MSIDFQIKDFFYPRKIWRLHREFEVNQWLPPEKLQDYQLRCLQKILNHAFNHVPYYRQLFRSIGFHPSEVTKTEHIQQLPLLTKDTIRENLTSLMAENIQNYSPVKASTSGSSGKPLEFYLDRNSQSLEFVYYWRHWGWGGYRLGAVFAELSGHFFLIHPDTQDWETSYQFHLRRLLLNSNRLSRSSCVKMAEEIRRRGARFLKGLSSTLYFFALNLRDAGIDDIRFDCIFSTGEIVTQMHRQLIEEVFQSPLLDSYGHMERTVAISQCKQGSYHVNSDYGLLEAHLQEREINGSQHSTPVIGTSFHNFAMPLIRYDTGDQIELGKQNLTCTCGRTFPLIEAIHGRNEDVIITPDGRYLTTLFIVPEFVSGIDFIQFVQTSPDRLEVRVVPGPGWDETASERLDNYTNRMTGESLHVKVCVISTEELIRDRSGKIRAVISYLTESNKKVVGV